MEARMDSEIWRRIQRGCLRDCRHTLIYTIYGFMLARLIGSVALFYLSTITLGQCEKVQVGECPEAYFTIPYVSLLSESRFLSDEDGLMFDFSDFGTSRAMPQCWLSSL